MLGWEFPPYVTGGLGVACYGLAKSLNSLGVDVLFVLPKPVLREVGEVRTVSPASVAAVADAVEAATPAPEAVATGPSGEIPEGIEYHPDRHFIYVERDETQWDNVDFERVTFVPVDVWLQPYLTPEQYLREQRERITQVVPRPVHWTEQREEMVMRPRAREASGVRSYIEEPPQPEQKLTGPEGSNYAGDLFEETSRYAQLALGIAAAENFDVVHAHDWMTFEAAIAVAGAHGKPLVVQIHSTEIDRAGDRANGRVMAIERRGLAAADRVIAVSYRTKTQLIERYNVDPRKIEVVYGAPADSAATPPAQAHKAHGEKIVLFLGRLTRQKGPDYFLQAAKKVVRICPHTKFVLAGSGDATDEIADLVENLDLESHVIFTGNLKKREIEKLFKVADLYVMPSVSEPFGIAPLEAISHDVPVMISKQSGVAEVLKHVLKVDFWDTDEMANKIVAVLKHPPLAQTLREHGKSEVRQLSWADAAGQIVNVYEELAEPAVS